MLSQRVNDGSLRHMVEEAENGDSLLVLDAVDEPSDMAEEAKQSTGSGGGDERHSRQNRNSEGGENSGRRNDRSRSPIRRGKRNFVRYTDNSGIGNKTDSDDPYLKRARLFVGNIDLNNVTRRRIIELFSQYGRVLGVSVHKGYAFVQMDKERNANRAIVAEDNQMFQGSKLHVEFSAAALKAGARIRPLQPSPPPPLPMRERERDLAVMHPLEAELEHEDRLSRILKMERELAYIRARDDIYSELYTRSQMDTVPHSMHKEDYRRPPLSPSHNSGAYVSPREPPLDHAERFDDRRQYYSRSDAASSMSRAPPDARAELLSYPIPRGRNTSRSDPLAAAYGGSATSVGFGVGGYSTGGKPRAGVANPPPGWPSGGGYQRATNSRGPFSSGYWD